MVGKAISFEDSATATTNEMNVACAAYVDAFVRWDEFFLVGNVVLAATQIIIKRGEGTAAGH